MLENKLKNVVGVDFRIEIMQIKGMPLYMVSGRKFYRATMGDIPFLLVELLGQDRFGAVALKKQLVQYSEKTGLNVVFGFDGLTRVQRDALIAREIPFISFPDQIYLPFLGVMLSNRFREKSVLPVERMTPATQCLFLYLLYRRNEEYIIKKQAADDLGLTRTSITRASEQLKQMKLIIEENYGKEIRMNTVSQGFELYLKARNHLISPVQKVLQVEYLEQKGFYLAGESSLSRHSMLAKPAEDTFAIFKGQKTAFQFREVDARWQDNIKTCRIEIWKYDPALFSIGGEVDPVSLAMSLSDNEDERVQGELQAYLEKYKW